MSLLFHFSSSMNMVSGSNISVPGETLYRFYENISNIIPKYWFFIAGMTIVSIIVIANRYFAKNDLDRRFNIIQKFVCILILILSLVWGIFNYPLSDYISVVALLSSMIVFFDEGAISKNNRILTQIEKMYGLKSLKDTKALIDELGMHFDDDYSRLEPSSVSIPSKAGSSSDIKKIVLMCASPAIGALAGDNVRYNRMRAAMISAASELKGNFTLICYEPYGKDNGAELFASKLNYDHIRKELFARASRDLIDQIKDYEVKLDFRKPSITEALQEDSNEHSLWFFHLCLVEYGSGVSSLILWHLEEASSESPQYLKCSGFSTSQSEFIMAFSDSITRRIEKAGSNPTTQQKTSAPDAVF